MCGGLVVSISQSWSVPPDGSFPSVTRLINTKLLIYVSQDTQGRRSRMICLALIRRRVARLRSLTGCSENCKHLPRDWIQQVLNCIRQRAKTFKRSLIYYSSLCVRVYLHVSVCVYFIFFPVERSPKLRARQTGRSKSTQIQLGLHPSVLVSKLAAQLSYLHWIASIPFFSLSSFLPFHFSLCLSLRRCIRCTESLGKLRRRRCWSGETTRIQLI